MSGTDPVAYVHAAALGTAVPEVAASLAPLLRAGLGAGDTVVLACSPPLATALQDRLPGPGLHTVDPAPLRGRAPDALAGYSALVDRFTATGSRVQLVTDSAGLQASDLAAWLQTEALLDLVLADRPVDHFCMLDEADLGEETARALACHPSRLGADGVQDNHDRRDPAEVLRSLGSAPGPDPLETTRPTLEMTDVDSMRDLRRALTASLADGPLAPDEAGDLVLAIDEVVSNAAEHGVPPVDVRLWVTGHRVLCVVADRGQCFDEPLVGYGPAHGRDLSVGGMGLWLARRAVDRMTTAPLEDGDGCVVRLVIDPRAA